MPKIKGQPKVKISIALPADVVEWLDTMGVEQERNYAYIIERSCRKAMSSGIDYDAGQARELAASMKKAKAGTK